MLDSNSALVTEWGKRLLEAGGFAKRAEAHPRPTMQRGSQSWVSLDGVWECTVTEGEFSKPPERFDGSILVPFPFESLLSGQGGSLGPGRILWYRRIFEAPEVTSHQKLLLHFGAVDWEARVWLNGKYLGKHRGGYDPFYFDITQAIEVGANELLVATTDPTEAGKQPRGKQVSRPHGIWYTACSGIWQSVWLERVPSVFVGSLSARGIPETGDVDLVVRLAGAKPFGGDGEIEEITFGESLHTRVVVRLLEGMEGEEEIARTIGAPHRPLRLRIDGTPRLWSPEDPFLYGLEVRVENALNDDAGFSVEPDVVRSYIGLRKVGVAEVGGIPRITLNGEPRFLFGFLDQGYWPDGIYTAPSDDALRKDVEKAKNLGANVLRKHVKVEPERYYYWCDRIGMMVLQDMPSGTFGYDPAGKAMFRRELKAMLHARAHHPSIIGWVIFNEGWGQHDGCAIAEWVKSEDPERLVIAASGWVDEGCGDVRDVHAYPAPNDKILSSEGVVSTTGRTSSQAVDRRPLILGEFGGLGLEVKGHTWTNSGRWAYELHGSREELTRRYEELLERLRGLAGRGLCGAIYTQLTDVEGEVNGVLTYDRAVTKVDPDTARKAAERLTNVRLF